MSQEGRISQFLTTTNSDATKTGMLAGQGLKKDSCQGMSADNRAKALALVFLPNLMIPIMPMHLPGIKGQTQAGRATSHCTDAIGAGTKPSKPTKLPERQ